MDLDIFGAGVRVLCDEAGAAETLRTRLADHVSAAPAAPSFVIQSPERGRRLHMLLDRSGFVLARSTDVAGCVESLLAHLGAFVPVPDDVFRIHSTRALVGENGDAVLMMFPLGSSPPLVERRLLRAGFAVVDRLVVDLHGDASLALVAPPWGVGGDKVIDGHLSMVRDDHHIGTVMVPTAGGSFSTAQVVATLASSMGADSHGVDARITLADALVRANPVAVHLDERSALYRALEALR